MWLVWTGGDDRLWDVLTVSSLGTFDLLKTISSHPAVLHHDPHQLPGRDAEVSLRLRTAQSVSVPRHRQRALFQGGDRPGSGALRSVARSARSRVSSGSVRRSRQVSRRQGRRKGKDDPGRLLLRRAHRHCRAAPLSQSCVRRKGTAALERRSFLQRSGVLLGQGSRPPVPRRHVVRVLPRRSQSDQASGGSREPEMGEPELERRRPVLLVGSGVQLARRGERAQPLLPGAARLASRDARHVARVHRQHQQSADDERGVPAAAADAADEALGPGGRLRAAACTTSSSTTTCRRAIRWRSSSRRRAPPGRRGC